MSPFVQSLSRSLFWDVDPETVDEVKHRRFIIQRVLERGQLDDWRHLRDHYTIPVILHEAQQIRSLEPTALSFIACVGGAGEETFRCSTLKRLNPELSFY